MEQVKVNVVADHNEVVIRTGEALPLKEPTPVKISGSINSVTDWLKKRIKDIKQKNAYIEVFESGMIKLIIEEKSSYKDSIEATILLNKDFEEFGINETSKKFSLIELSNFIKMRRIFFEEKEVAMKMVTTLRDFRGKVNKEMEKFQDTRGNARVHMEQVVTSNIPPAFTLNMPIFKNDVPRKFNVEVNIVVRDQEMECYLESVEASDIIRQYREDSIKDQLKDIQTIAPDIVIIYK